MKKLISLVAALTIAASAFAQLGVVGGITSSSTQIEAAIADVNNVTQYHAGIALKLPITNFLTLQPEVIYNVKGTNISTINLGDLKNEIDMTTGFIEVPVQVQLGWEVLNGLRVYGFGEPFVGYGLDNNVKYSSVDDVKKDWDNIKNRLEYGVAAGAGVEFMKHFQLSVKYFWNIGDFYDANLEAVKEAVKGSCSGISASLAIFF